MTTKPLLAIKEIVPPARTDPCRKPTGLGVNNEKLPYAWFVSYAKDGSGKQVAVAVMVDDADAVRSEISGNGLAGPIAKSMMQAALKTS